MDIKLTININTDNSAFDDYNKELKRILYNIVFKIMKYSEVHNHKLYDVPDRMNTEVIRDINGNKVGNWSYEEVSE